MVIELGGSGQGDKPAVPKTTAQAELKKKEQLREQSKRYYQRHREQLLEKSCTRTQQYRERVNKGKLKRYHQNPQPQLEASHKWYQEHTEQALENQRKWREKNPEWVNERQRGYYKRKKEAEKPLFSLRKIIGKVNLHRIQEPLLTQPYSPSLCLKTLSFSMSFEMIQLYADCLRPGLNP
jgi:hypothetical protein